MISQSGSNEKLSAAIPKRAMFIYSRPEGESQALPPRCKAALSSFRMHHPDFECEIYGRDEIEDFISSEYPEFRDEIRRFPLKIQRIDVFRYLVIYRKGGFYFDLDIYFSEGLQPLLGEKCVFAFEELTLSRYLRQSCNLDWELANYGFGSVPGHPFIGQLIDNCFRGLREPAWLKPMIDWVPLPFRDQFVAPVTTGPGMVSRTFAEYCRTSGDITVLFPQDVCDERYWQQFGEFAVHIMQASWRKTPGFVRGRLARMWEARLRSRTSLDSCEKGAIRQGNWISRFPVGA